MRRLVVLTTLAFLVPGILGISALMAQEEEDVSSMKERLQRMHFELQLVQTETALRQAHAEKLESELKLRRIELEVRKKNMEFDEIEIELARQELELRKHQMKAQVELHRAYAELQDWKAKMEGPGERHEHNVQAEREKDQALRREAEMARARAEEAHRKQEEARRRAEEARREQEEARREREEDRTAQARAEAEPQKQVPVVVREQPRMSGEEAYQAAYQAYEGKEFLEAARCFMIAAREEFQPANSLYNAACSLALAGKNEQAMKVLSRAVVEGFDDIDHIRRDSDLESLHNLPAFKKLIGDAQGWTGEEAAPGKMNGAEAYEAAYVAYEGEDYLKGANLFLAAAEAGFEPANSRYNAACCLSLAGKKEHAMKVLLQAVEEGFDDGDHIEEDPDLENLHEMPEFERLIEDLGERGSWMGLPI